MKSKPFLHNPTLFTLFTLTTLILISLSTSQTPTSIQLRFETEIEITSNAPAFFQLAPQTYSADSSYLSVSALSDKNCTPILAVSKTTQNPTTKENSDYYFGGEPSKAILFIPTQNLKDQNVYIGVSSDSQCSITVTVEEAYNFKVTPDVDEYYSVYELHPNDLREKTSVVLSIDIPDIPDPDRILLHLNGINLDQRNKPYLDVFVKKGDQAPDSSNYDQVSMRQWFEGVTVLIYKDSPAFCTNCRITVSMKIEENAFLQVHVGVLHNLLNLRAYAIIDGLETGRQNTYVATFNANSKDSNLRISINPIQGNFSLYMNCDSKPDNLSDFTWNFTIDSFESILLTPREHANCETSTYYIVLTGNSGDNAFYSIGAQQKFNNKLFMEKDIGNMGDIVPGEPVIYDVFVPVYAAEKITLDLITQGNIDISIKNCRYASDCPDLLPPTRNVWEVLNEVIGTVWPEDFKIEVVDTGHGKKVTIDPHKNGCVPFMMRDDYQGNIPLPVCAYKIELKSNETAQYNLIADLEGHNLILPGYPIEGAVLVNDKQYYVLYAPYDDLKSVAIQLTTLSGDLDLYVSNTTLFPSEENDTTQFSHAGLILYTNTTSLNGTYYITVKGHQTSSFILTATLITKDGREEDYSVRLHEGIPQKGVLLPRHEHPMLFYSINVFFDNEWEGSLKITINPNHGNLAMTVSSNGQIPQPNFNQWQSTQHELTILSTDRFFNRRGIYYIGIYPDPDDSSTLSYDEVTFNIVYSFQTTGKGEDINKELEYLTPLNANHILLSSDSTFEGRINKGEIRFFKFNAYSSDDTVTVSLQSSSDSVALFASTNTSQPYPGPDDYTFTTKDTYRNYITITRDDLKKTCFGDVQLVVTCPIYLSLITTTGDELPFALDITRGVAQNDTSRTHLTQLSTGKERLFKVPADNQFIYFYFYTLPDIESLITVTARHHDIEIYAKVAELTIGQDINTYFGDIETMDYPESSGQKEMTMTSYSNLRVPAMASTNPIVVFAKLRFTAHQGEAFDYSSQPTFSIIASNVVTHIFPGKVYNSESYDDDTYQYYSFYVPDPEQSFKITLTSLSDANQDMYLTYSKLSRPTQARHDFYSASSPRVEELSVTPLDIYPRKLMNGTWVIGVYAETKGQYSLLVTFGNQVVQLVESSPIEEYLPENSKAYFSYYNDHATDLYLKLGKMSGNPVLYINSLQPGASVQDNIPSKTNYTWMFKPSRQAATTAIKATDPKYCSHCLYVMTVETDEQVSKFSLIVLEKGHWELAQNDVTYSDTVPSQDTKGYFFITSSAAGASLNIKVLTGKLNVYTSHNPTANTTNYIDKVQVETSDRYKELNMSQDYLNGHPDQAEIFDGSRDVASDPWGYYVILENLESTDVAYTILFRDIGSEQTLITANIRQHLVVTKEGEQDVLFYSSSKGGVIKASIEYTLSASAQDDQLGFSALYWSEKAITGLGKTVDIRKDDVNVDKVRDGVKYMRKNVEIKSEVGKYQFTIENPTQEVISFSILVYTAQDVSFVSLESNSYHFSRLRADQTETFEVYLPGAGSWYLEMNQCSGKLRIAIADSTDDLTNVNNLFIPDSDSFLHKFYSKNAGSKYIRVFAEEADVEDGASFLLRNFYFKEDSLINFDKATAGQVAELSGQYNSDNNSLPVSFEPISFAGSKKEDFVLYKVVACQDEGLARTIALCDMRPLDEATGENCQFDEFSQDLSQPVTGQTSLDLAPGDYHLYIVGNIVHNGEMVHSVTYPPATVTLKGHSGVTFDQVKSYLPYVGAGVGLLVALVVGFAVYAKYKKKKEVRRQTELENFRRRGYGIMQEEF